MTSDGGPATGAAGAGAGAAGRLLGHRSLLLHWEVKRHQAWWKKVLDRGLLTRLAEHASSKALLARTAAEHSHVALLKRAGDVLCERTKKRAGGGKLSSLVDRAAQAAGGSVQDQELAAILCGCCDGWRTDVLFTPLAVEDGHRSQRAPGAEGALASVVHADARWDALDLEVTRLSNRRGLGSSGTAYQVRKKAGAFTEAVGHTRRVGGKVVVHPDVEGGEPPVRLVDEIRRARQWHDRHSACFIPLAWAVSAAFAAKWECSGGDADSVTRGEDSDNSGSRGGRGKGKKKGGSGGKASVRRPSPSSVLALVAAFLDKESTAKGFISGSLKAMFGGGPRVSFGKINPNLGELLLLFMSFLKGLGTTQHTVGALELSGDGTVSQQQPSAAEKRASQGDVRDRAIRLSVDGRAVQDITDVRVVSLLRRTCDSVQLALTPNAACGLPVWGNDPRWSLLGHVLGSSAETGGVIEEVVDRGVPAASRCYLTWMDDLLEMCEEHDEGGMCTGLPGFTLTGSTTKQSSKAAAQLSKRHSADIRKARLADAAFVAATTPGGSLAAQGTAGRGWVGAAVNAFGQQHAGENAGGGDDDDNDATMSVVDGDADKISTLSSSLYEGSDIDGEEMDENNPLLRQPRPTAGDILEGGSEGDGAGAASSPAQSTTGDGATVAMRSRMGTSVSRSGGGWETVAEGVESVVEASDKMEDVLARGERVLQEAARMVAAAKAASGVASSKGRGVRDVAPGVGGKSAATEASGQPGKECASSSTGVPADPLSKQIDDVNPSTRGRVMQGEEQGKQMTADDAAVSATPRSREVTERERARALAKERGRERGKQRQQQCEKERLLKLKELVRKRERKLETEAREKRRQEEEWEAEALRAERRKTRLERWERGTERRTVGIKEEMGKSVLREADEVDDNGNRDGDLKQKGTDSSGSSSSSSDSSSDRSESHSQTQSRDCRSGSSNGASVRGERRGRNGTDSSDNRVSSSTASRSPRAARVLGSSRDGSSCVAEGISVNRRGESGTRAEYIAVSNLSGDGVKASGDAEQGHGESKWSPWRSVSSSNDSEDADDVVKGAMLTPAVDKGNEELAETTDAHTFRAHRSSSGSVDGSDVAHRRLGRSVDGSLDWRYVQTNSQYNTRSRANSVESNDVDWRIRSRKRQVIVDVGGAAGRGSNRTHRPVSGDHRVITEREMEESRPQSKRRARNSRSISNSTERRPRRLSRSRERQRDPSQSRERRYVQERGQFGRNADDRRPGWSPVGDRRHRNARSERSRDRSRSIERGRARSPSSHNLQSGARPLRSGSNEANHSRSLITQRRAHDCRSRSREGRSRDDDRPGGSRSRNNSRPRQSRSQESRSPQEELPTTTAGMLEAGAQGTMMGSAISVGSVRQAGNVKSIGPGRKGMMASSASTAAAACAAISAKVSAQGGADIAYNPTAVANAVHGTGWPVIHLQIPATTSLDQAGTASPTTAAVQTLAEEGCADSGHSTGRDGVRSGVKGTFAAVPTSMKRDVNWSGVVDLPHSSTWKSLGKSSPHDSPWRPNPLPETEQTAQGQPSLPLPLPLPLPPPPPSRLRPSFDTQMEGLAQRSAAAVAEVEGGGAAAQDDRSAVRRGPAFPDAMHTESLSGLAGDGAEPYLLT